MTQTATAEREPVQEVMPPAEEGQQRGVTRINDRLSREIADKVEVRSTAGGLNFQSYGEVMEFAKLMAQAGGAVPIHCRGNAGVCLAITTQAVEWRMSPFAVANKSYYVNDRVAYESQMIHAVIEARAPLTGRLRCEYSGSVEDGTRRCKVIGYLKGEQEPFVFESEPIARLLPEKNSSGQYKGSPLWGKKPDLQLWYNASRDWARMWVPDVIMGIYSEDELDEVLTSRASQEPAASPKLLERLAGRIEGDGFHPDAVKNGTEERTGEQTAAAPHGDTGTAQEPQGASQGASQPAGAQDTGQGENAQDGEADGQDAGGKRKARERKPAAAKEPKATAKPPEEAKPEPKPAAEPKTVAEYIAYAEAWIDGLKDGDAGAAQWKAEIKLRNTCNLLEDDRMALKGRLDAKIKTLAG